MRHMPTFLVATLKKMVKIGVNLRSYRKMNTVLSLFWTTLLVSVYRGKYENYGTLILSEQQSTCPF